MQEMLRTIRRAELLAFQHERNRVQVFDVLRSEQITRAPYLADEKGVHPVVEALHHRTRWVANDGKERIAQLRPVSPNDREGTKEGIAGVNAHDEILWDSQPQRRHRLTAVHEILEHSY